MIQVLISTMYLTAPAELLSKMKIETEAIIIDQCDYQGEECITFNDNTIYIYHTTERGLSRSRNMAISKATADILIFADDDFFYSDDYNALVHQAYEQTKDAEVVVFGAVRADGYVYRRIPTGKMSNKYKFSINSIRITAKREALIKNNILFDVKFGAGSDILGGEDTIFISDCFCKKLNVYSCDTVLCRGLESDRLSTWFFGYTENFFVDRGTMFRRLAWYYPLLIFYFAVKNRKRYSKDVSFFKAVQSMFRGAKKK